MNSGRPRGLGHRWRGGGAVSQAWPGVDAWQRCATVWRLSTPEQRQLFTRVEGRNPAQYLCFSGAVLAVKSVDDWAKLLEAGDPALIGAAILWQAGTLAASDCLGERSKARKRKAGSHRRPTRE